MAAGTLKIHTENILPIIKKWLYSEKDIFVRELISNSCDAIHKCKVLQECGEMEQGISFQIQIQIDKEKKTLTFTDNGIGMSAEEVEKYIAQVAFSGAEEFVQQYQSSKEIIGHFGLGFYSSYMVSSSVTLDTLSYRSGSVPALWSCDGSASYTLDTGVREERGTSITLHIDKENEEFLEERRLKEVLQHYCAFLPVPITLNGTQINKKEPLWLKNSTECEERDYLEFYRALYPHEPDPIFWVHLNVDYPFHLQGILYFPKISRSFDFNKSATKLFCNRVFVSDSCKELIPDYLSVLRGAIDSPDIPLNVSRSTLQMDKTVRQLASHISKKVSDRLSSLYTLEREKFIALWPDVEMIIKLGMLQDDKFYERSQGFLLWKTTEGAWTTLAEYKGEKVFYVSEEQKSSPLLALYNQKGIEVLIASSLVDTPLMNLLEEKLENIKFQRIDGAIHDHLLDATREKTLLDANGKTESAQIASFIKSHLPEDKALEVEAKSLHDDATAAFLVLDEEMRRFKETMALSRQSLPLDMPSKKTFVVNTNSRLIQALYRLQDKPLAEELVRHVYDLSLLSHKEMSADALAAFATRSGQLLEKLVVT